MLDLVLAAALILSSPMAPPPPTTTPSSTFTRPAEPEPETRRKAAEGEYELARRQRTVLFERQFDHVAPAKSDRAEWIELQHSGPRIEIRTGAGNSILCRVTTESPWRSGVEVLTLVRFRDRTPTYAVLSQNVSQYDQHYKTVRVEGDDYYLVDRSQLGRSSWWDSGRVARTTMFGPTWRFHEGRAQIRVLIVAK